jgi:poly-gamma-glutamate capsule biosynthesis protein CapA/YwtB (metallophosphatase superfamily)
VVWRALWAVLAVCLVVFGLVAAARQIRPAERPTLGAAPAPKEAARPPTQRRARPAPATAITVAFGGDVHFEGRVDQRLRADPASTFGPVAAVLSRADLAMVNLETSITDRGTPEPKDFYFRAPPTAFTALRSAGVDVATMANNHGVDFGLVGLRDSLAASQAARFPVVGIGPDAVHAYAPWYTTLRGHRVAILAASQIADRTLAVWRADEESPGIASAYSDRLVAAVRDARRHAEVVVVYVHWGEEGKSCPLGVQRDLAGRLAAAGADAVVGTHAHLLLGGGWLESTYVAYGLGNFLWWRDNAYSNDTGVLVLTFRGRRAVAAALVPARIDERGVPVPATGPQADRILTDWDQLRPCTGLASTPNG